MSLIILLIVASISVASANADDRIQSIYPQVDCDESIKITREDAYEDFLK